MVKEFLLSEFFFLRFFLGLNFFSENYQRNFTVETSGMMSLLLLHSIPHLYFVCNHLILMCDQLSKTLEQFLTKLVFLSETKVRRKIQNGLFTRMRHLNYLLEILLLTSRWKSMAIVGPTVSGCFLSCSAI